MGGTCLVCGAREGEVAKLHYFPNKLERARRWLTSCHREDLLELSPERLYNGHRICADHFEQKMFTNRFCNRLNINAVPTLFPSLEGSSRDQDNSDSSHDLVLENVESSAKRIKVWDGIVVEDPLELVKEEGNIETPEPFIAKIPRSLKVEQMLHDQLEKMRTKKQACSSYTPRTSKTPCAEPDSSDIESNEKIPSVLSADTQFMRTIMREKPMDRSETSIPTSFTDIGQDEQQESELYCRLCFCVSTDSNNHINIFPSHGENSCRQEKIQQMILNIIPDLDLSLTYNPGICTDCERRLVDTYDFIMLSIYNQNTIIDYKSKHSDEVYVKIQDVVKPSNDTSNKRPMPELSYFPSKKVRTSIGNTNRTETGGARGATEVEEVTIKEEFDFDVFESVEGTEKQSVEEHSCTDLSTTSADKDIRDMELTKDSAPDFEKLITKIYKIPDRKEENRSGQENTIKLVDISSIIRPAETIRVNAEGNRHSHMIVEGTKIKVIRAQKSDISKS